MNNYLNIKWNNHVSAFSKLLNQIYLEKIYSDATIMCGEKFYPVHQLVLSAYSEYFEKMFEQCRIFNKHPFIVIKETEPEEMEALLNYMYKGEVCVPRGMLTSLVKAADIYQIKGLAVVGEQISPSIKGSTSTSSASSSQGKCRKSEENDKISCSKKLKCSHTNVGELLTDQPTTSKDSNLDNSIPDAGTSSSTLNSDDLISDIKIEPIVDPLESNMEEGFESNENLNTDFDSNSQTVNSSNEKQNTEEQCITRSKTTQSTQSPKKDQDKTISASKKGFVWINASVLDAAPFRSLEKPLPLEKKDGKISNQPLTSGVKIHAPTTEQPGTILFSNYSQSPLKFVRVFKTTDSNATHKLTNNGKSAVLIPKVNIPAPQKSFQNEEESIDKAIEEKEKSDEISKYDWNSIKSCPFPNCGYNCPYPSRLQMHYRIHTGEKPFKCSICTFRCSQSSNLHRHVRSAHLDPKIGPFKCSFCNLISSNEDELKTHVASKHS